MPTRQIHFRPAGERLSISRETAGFDHVSFEVRSLGAGRRFSAETGSNELGIVMLGGICSVDSSAGGWRPGRGGGPHFFVVSPPPPPPPLKTVSFYPPTYPCRRPLSSFS